jgi:biopolymer transport protein ExbB
MNSTLFDQFSTLWNQALAIWLSGGWSMVPIAFIAMVIFVMGVHVNLGLSKKGFKSVPERKWRKWIKHPELRRGPIGRLLELVTSTDSVEETVVFFDELRKDETAVFDRDLKVMKICVSAAPLLGLLGTVTGMLSTFGALASGSGGEKTMEMVAKGISEALITTETGLVVALPGILFQYMLVRQNERYKAFLAHLESVCTQMVYKKTNEQNRMNFEMR